MSRFLNWKGALVLVVVLAIIAVGAWVLLSSDDDEGDQPEPAKVTVLTVSGSGGTTAILEAVKPAFEADTPGYQLEILTGTSTGGGVKGVLDGTLDVAAMARAPKDDEAIEYAEFGWTGQALFVHQGVGDINLTSEQASAIFFGKTANWSEVGGPDLAIVLYVRDDADSSTAALREAIFGDEPFPETAQVMTSQGDMINAVAGIEGAVGFGTWPAVVAKGANVKPVSVDGVNPADSSYPIVGALGIGFLADRQTDVQPLIEWLLSDAGKTALRKVDVIVG
jgi:phosphate transport system substrate-binding protein